MAYVYHDDFEWMTGTNADLLWRFESTTDASAIGSSGLSGMTGRYYRSGANGNTFYSTAVLPTAITEGVFSAAVYLSGDGVIAQRNLIALTSGSSVNIAIRLNTDYSLSILRDSTVIATSSANVVPFAKRFRIQVSFVINDSTGECTVKIDRGGGLTTAVSQTGYDSNTAGGNVDRFRLYNQASNNNTNFDDIYIDSDKTWNQNDFTFTRLAPSADVSGVSTPSTGSDRYAMIDETPASTTDYNTFATTGEDVFDIADLAATPQSILGVGTFWLANKTITDPVTARSRILSNTDYGNGTTANLSATITGYSDFVPLDPQGGGSWTKARVDAAKLVIERVS